MEKANKKSKKKNPTGAPENATSLPTIRPGPEIQQKKVRTDVLGSYTGVALGGGIPTQDADDL